LLQAKNATTTPVPFKTLQEEIDELHDMLEKEFEENEEAVADVMEKANETEKVMEQASDHSEDLLGDVEKGKVDISSKDNETLIEQMEESEKASVEAKEEMREFKDVAHEKLVSMSERAHAMMIKYRDLSEKAEATLIHAQALEKNLTRAQDAMEVAKSTIHASVMQSQEAEGILEAELAGRVPVPSPEPEPVRVAEQPSSAFFAAVVGIAILQ
jgi:chromosome segregation ATPase